MRYFDITEFDSPDIGSGGEMMQESTLNMLDDARGIAGIPFKINSGYRTPEHNKKVGGTSNSAHLDGYAVDIACSDSRSRWIIVEALIMAGFNRIGIADTFIHVDNQPSKPSDVIWTY